ncbi:MAG: hypothetical protein U0326_09965 [Polyangiales bacterium]
MKHHSALLAALFAASFSCVRASSPPVATPSATTAVAADAAPVTAAADAATDAAAAPTVATPAPLPASFVPGALMNVLTYGNDRWAVLAPVTDGEEWHEGDAQLIERTEAVVTRANVRRAAVPPALLALDGAEVTLGGRGASTCRATLRGLAVLSRQVVHFGTSQRWDGELPDGTRGPHATPAQIASDAWGQGMLLVARVEAPANCGEDDYARLASLPASTAFVHENADAALTRRVLERYRALPAWRTLEGQYHDNGGTRGRRWDEHGDEHPTVTVWHAQGATKRYVVVNATTAVGGCAEFNGSLWAVFEAEGATLTLRTDGTTEESFSPIAAVDTDGDGAPEFVLLDGTVKLTEGAYRRSLSIAPPNHDCPC